MLCKGAKIETLKKFGLNEGDTYIPLNKFKYLEGFKCFDVNGINDPE
jgi:hypothetical protein